MSSTDGWCSLINFKPEELGKVYKPEAEEAKENSDQNSESKSEDQDKLQSESPKVATLQVKKKPKDKVEPMVVESSAWKLQRWTKILSDFKWGNVFLGDWPTKSYLNKTKNDLIYDMLVKLP